MSHESSQPNPETPSLEFVVPFGDHYPEVPEEEQTAVAEKFRSLVDDAMLNHSHEVDYFVAEQVNSLLLRKPEAGEPEMLIFISKYTDDKHYRRGSQPAEDLKITLTLQRNDDNTFTDLYTYRMGADGVLRRADRKDVFASSDDDNHANPGVSQAVYEGFADFQYYSGHEGFAEFHDYGSDESDESHEATAAEPFDEAYLEELEAAIDNGIRNLRLEREMGLNDQPVSLPEMEGLAAYLSQPELEAELW